MHNVSLAVSTNLLRFLADTTSDKFFVKAHLASAVADLELVQVFVRALRHLGHDVVEDLQFAARENAVEGLPNANHDDQHEGKENGRRLEGLDEPQPHEAGELNQREEMHALDWHLIDWEIISLFCGRYATKLLTPYLSQEHVVRLVLDWHQHNE